MISAIRYFFHRLTNDNSVGVVVLNEQDCLWLQRLYEYFRHGLLSRYDLDKSVQMVYTNAQKRDA